MSASHDQDAAKGRRKAERRVEEQGFPGADKRAAERRSGDDRRAAPRHA